MLALVDNAYAVNVNGLLGKSVGIGSYRSQLMASELSI